MRKLSLYLLLCIVAFATGCPKYKPTVDFKNKDSFVSKLNEYFRARQMEYISVLGNNPNRAKTIRNEVIEAALPYIDDAYSDYITGLQSGRDKNNFVADVIELGTSAAVGITNGERPLQILGVALTAFRGGRRSADLNFYKEQTTPILISKMDGNRARVRATILTREKEGVDNYPMGAAISDIVEYYNAGTLVRAFTELQKDTAVLTRQSEDNVRVLKGVPITPEKTPEQRDMSVGSRRVLERLLTELNGTPEQQQAATETLQTIVAQLETDDEVKAVLKNANISATETDGKKLRTGLISIRRSAQLVNNNALVNKINQAIVDSEP